MKSDYFAVHAHSHFSGMDGMNEVQQMVDRVVELGQPALALTDHGTMAGTVQLYKACQKAGIAPYPGAEFYIVRDVNDDVAKDIRYHLGMVALDAKGYEALTKLSTLSWKADHFFRKPLIDLSDLAFLHDEGYSDHIAVTTGCYSSMVVQTLIERGPKAAENVIKMLANWFPNTLYVELQDHGIQWPASNYFVDGLSDNDIMLALWTIARKLGIPVIFGGDSHYIHPHQQPTHDLMKDICYFGAGEDQHFNGGPYHLLSAEEVRAKIPTGTIWNDIEDGFEDLLDRHALSIRPLDSFKFNMPKMSKTPNEELRTLAEKGLIDNGWDNDPVYVDRMEEELDVIAKMGFADYFLLVKTHVIDFARDHDIIVNCRGSVNGSLVTRLIGVSNVDPIKRKTNFGRFLSIQRKKAPDIDVDVSFLGRRAIIDHLAVVFPTMTQVATYAQIGFGKPDPDTGEETGSVIVQYMAAQRKKDPNFNGKVKKEHWDALNDLAETPVYKSLGTNAAGFILPGDGHSIDKYLPLARVISSDTQVTQYSKDDVEAMGYVKVDILGLRALETLNGTLRDIGRPLNDWDWIPDDDPKACALVRQGHTAGIFQYEGWTNRRGGMEMKVKSTADFIIGIALFRPALINGGQKDLYLANRGKARAEQKRLHTIFDFTLDDTAGVPIYQEQVMEMLQAIGMEFEDYNDLMTAIKASNGFIQGAAKTFKRIMPIFYDLCADAGLSDQDADDAWEAVIGFTEYGFNKAHSTGYGEMAYYAAYLKAHYPLEFMANLLAVWTGDKDKEGEYIPDAKRLGFSIVKADVNHSDAVWTIDQTRPNALRRGLASIKGIGMPTGQVIEQERKTNGRYADVDDFLDRLPAKAVTRGKDWKSKGVLIGSAEVLRRASAFRTIGS